MSSAMTRSAIGVSIAATILSASLLASCAGTPRRNGCFEKGSHCAVIRVRFDQLKVSNGDWAKGLMIGRIDGKEPDDGSMGFLQPGTHDLSAGVVWSNGHDEYFQIPLVMEPDARYWLAAMEVAPTDLGSTRVSVDKGNEMAQTFKDGASILFGPLVVLGEMAGSAIHSDAKKDRGPAATARPQDRKCFVWIERWAATQDFKSKWLLGSGQVIWGESPLAIADAPKVDAQPTHTGIGSP